HYPDSVNDPVIALNLLQKNRSFSFRSNNSLRVAVCRSERRAARQSEPGRGAGVVPAPSLERRWIARPPKQRATASECSPPKDGAGTAVPAPSQAVSHCPIRKIH